MTKFEELLKRDETNSGDWERCALFFIISYVGALYSQINEIYDFNERRIKPDSLNTLPLSGGEQRMLKLAFNLFNNLNIDYSILDLFGGMDAKFRTIAFHAITIRMTGHLMESC